MRAASHLIAVPDRGGRLADGLVVEASLVARLLRVRLLAIDARFIVAPAQVDAPPQTPRVRPHAVGARLAAAQRLLDAG